MNLLLYIFALRNISKGKAKKHHNIDNVEQNSNVTTPLVTAIVLLLNDTNIIWHGYQYA
jgi:ureidoglycolate hydrolase